MLLDDVLAKVREPERSGKGWVAYCPAHEDTRKRSLSIGRSTKNPKNAVLFCFAGCSIADIESALRGEGRVKVKTLEKKHETVNNVVPLKLKSSKLNPVNWLSEYTSLDPDWLETQAIRFDKAGRIGYVFEGSSAVKWRIYSSNQKGLWELSGDDPPPLWPALPSELEETVFISAGETDCLCLRACELDAFALTRGENAGLSKSLFRELKAKGAKEVVYVPDADEVGTRAVSRIRRTAESAALEFRTLDISEHLQASRGEKDLRSLVRRVGIDQVREELETEYLRGPSSILEGVDLSLEEQDVPWVVSPLLARGAVTLLSGQPKAGKTTFLFKLIDKMHTGGAVVGYNVNEARVVYFTENSKLVITEKAKQHLHGNPTHVRFVYRDNDALEDLPFDEAMALIFHNAKRFNAGLIVVDTLAGLGTVDDENEASAVTKLLRPIRNLALKHDIAVCLVHHLGKAGTERGSSVFRAEPDVLIRIDGEDTEYRTVKVKNNLILQQPDEVMFRMDEKGEYHTGLQESDFDTFVLSILPHKVDDAIGIRAMCEMIDLPFTKPSRDKVARALEKLIAKGKAARSTLFEGAKGTGKYYRVINIRLAGEETGA